MAHIIKAILMPMRQKTNKVFLYRNNSHIQEDSFTIDSMERENKRGALTLLLESMRKESELQVCLIGQIMAINIHILGLLKMKFFMELEF